MGNGAVTAATVEAPTMYTWDPTARIHSTGGVRSLAFSPDGSMLVVGGTGKVGNIDHLDAKARIEVFDTLVGAEPFWRRTLTPYRSSPSANQAPLIPSLRPTTASAIRRT